MTNANTTSPALQSEAETTIHLLDNWFDAIEVGLRERVREFIQAMIESELETALARPRYGRRPTADPQNGDGSVPGMVTRSRKSILQYFRSTFLQNSCQFDRRRGDPR